MSAFATTRGIYAENGKVEASVGRKITSSANITTRVEASDVADCTVTGIGSQGMISGNLIESMNAAQGPGISAGSHRGVRIEGNQVSGFSTGIIATSACAVVVRNTARSNTTNSAIHANIPVVTPATLGSNSNANISQ